MKLESLSCNHCGAPLEVPEGAKYVTCTHCERQLVVRRTDGARFTEVVEDLHEQVEKLTRQNEVAALDREWEAEKEQYLISGKHGHKQVPTKITSVIGGIVVAVFGTIWTAMACGFSGLASGVAGEVGLIALLFPLFGVLFVIAGIALAVNSYHKAGHYTRAYARYQQRRIELLSREQPTDAP